VKGIRGDGGEEGNSPNGVSKRLWGFWLDEIIIAKELP
jgi:hypothetical protein